MVPIQELLKPAISRFIRDHRNARVSDLMLRIPALGIDKHWIAAQIEGWQKASDKIPLWAACDLVIYPVRLSMEQCSSERTARYKASLVNGDAAIDLTGGLGVDSFFLSEKFKTLLYIEQQEELAAIAAHNFSALGQLNIEVRQGKSETFLEGLKQADWIYIDPARRKESQKVYKLNDCEPNVPAMQEELFNISPKILLKTSPILDITQALQELQHVEEIHIVSVDQECKEVLYLLNKQYSGEPLIVCVHDHKHTIDRFSFRLSEEQQTKVSFSDPLHYIYEPNASILKAGAFNSITRHFPVFKIHPSSHLYTSNEALPAFPGRMFRILHTAGYDKKELMSLLPEGKANIQTRNFPDSVEQIRKKTGLKEGGNRYLFATTLLNGKKTILICEK